MTVRSDVLVVACVAIGLIIGVVSGFLAGDARTFGGAGAMMGLVVGCLLTVLPPWTKRTSQSPGRWRER